MRPRSWAATFYSLAVSLAACSAPDREVANGTGGTGSGPSGGGMGETGGASGGTLSAGGASAGGASAGGASAGGASGGGASAGGASAGGGSSATGGTSSGGVSGSGGSTGSGAAGGSSGAGGGTGIVCPASQHECNGACVDNTPPNGCSQGCGPCTVPQHGIASCVSGECSFSCPAMCSKVGSGCDCPKAQCCSDSECNPAPGSPSWCYYGKCLIGPAKCDQKLCWAACTSCLGKTGGKCSAVGGGIYCTCDI